MAFSGQALATWSVDLQMKQHSPGRIPGTRSGCFDLPVPPFLTFLNMLFLFFLLFFFAPSAEGAGCGGKRSGFASRKRFRASRCRLFAIRAYGFLSCACSIAIWSVSSRAAAAAAAGAGKGGQGRGEGCENKLGRGSLFWAEGLL